MVCEKCGRELIEVTTIQDLCDGNRVYVHGGFPYKPEELPIKIVGECPK